MGEKKIKKNTQIPVRFFFPPSASPSARFPPSLLSLSRSPLAPRRLLGRRRRRPRPGAEAFLGLFAGDEHPPGTSIPSLPFPSLMLCEAEHRNPNLKLFSYLTILLTSKFLQKLLGVHVYTHVPLLDPPCIPMSFTVSAPVCSYVPATSLMNLWPISVRRSRKCSLSVGCCSLFEPS